MKKFSLFLTAALMLSMLAGCNFDLEGQEGWFDIEVDTENYTLTVTNAKEMPFRYPRGTGKLPEIEDPGQVEAVQNYVGMPDSFMNHWTAQRSVPGPFGMLANGMTRNIDPRKSRK